MITTFELLVTTMNKNKSQIIEMLSRMNVNSNVIVRCQKTDRNFSEKIHFNEYSVTIVWATDTGLSKNRNELLRLASADIILFADDDEKLSCNYKEEIISRFNQNVDYIDFSFDIAQNQRVLFKESKSTKIKKQNRTGVLNIAFKRKILLNNKIFFDERFGAGCEIDRGEDTIFRRDIAKLNLKHRTSSFVLFNLFENSRPSNCALPETKKALKSRCIFYGYFYKFSFVFIIKLFFQNRFNHYFTLKEAFFYAKQGKKMRQQNE